MIPVLIGLGVAAIGTFVAVNCWDDVVNWLNDFLPRLKTAWETVKKNIPHAAQLVAEKVKENGKLVMKIIHKQFYKEDGKWMEETTTRVVDESEVPPFIREKVAEQEKEFDITKEMEQELQLEI